MREMRAVAVSGVGDSRALPAAHPPAVLALPAGHNTGAQLCPLWVPGPSRPSPSPALPAWLLTFSPLAPGGPVMAWGRGQWAGEQGCTGTLPSSWPWQLCTHLPWGSSIPWLSLGTSRP